MRRALALAILIAGAACIGCKKEVNILDNLIAQPGAVADLGYSIQWQTSLALSGDSRLLYAQLMGDRLATLDSANSLSIIDVSTGSVLWSASLGSKASRFSRPVRDRNALVICSETQCFVFDIVDGNRLKAFDLSFVSNTTPVVTRGLIIHGSPSGIVFAQDIAKGLLAWHIQTGGAVTSNPQLVASTLFVGNNNGNLLALNSSSGAILWTKKAFARISGAPAMTENLMYVASADQSLYAFQRTTGKARWRYFTQSPLEKPPVPMGDLVMQQVPQVGLVAVNAFSGVSAWVRSDLKNVIPLYTSETSMYCWNNDSILVLSTVNGKTLKGVSLPASEHAFVDDAKNRNLYLVRLSGEIMKISPK